MKLLEELKERYDESEVLSGFAKEEGIALVDLAYLVMLVDEDLSDGELGKFRERIFGLTLSEGDMLQDVLSGGEITPPIEVREIVGDAEATDEFVETRSEKIHGEAHRGEALRVLATLSYSDGMAEDEEGICHEIGRRFGFDDDEIEKLLVDGAVDVWELGGERVD